MSSCKGKTRRRSSITRRPVSPARPEEIKILQSVVDKHLSQYQADPKSAEALLKVGDAPVANDIPPHELAAWTSVARVIINLHETITRN